LKPGHNKRKKDISCDGFTLLEILVAMVILTIAMAISYQAFSGTIRAMKRGTEVMDGIKYGDFAMTQLVSALNSMIYFNNQRKTYAFTIERSNVNNMPADMISFVTASGAMMPAHSPFTEGPHRVKIFVDEDYEGPGLFVLAMPAIADPDEFEDEYDPDPILVTRAIQGLEVLFWDEETEEWEEEWEPENSVPERILVTVYVVSADEDEEPIEFSRVLDIPVAASVKERLSGPTISGSTSSSSGTGSAGNTRNTTINNNKSNAVINQPRK
jgi:prepilin-type N-terminal cleavage/methylation domain-containing protein